MRTLHRSDETCSEKPTVQTQICLWPLLDRCIFVTCVCVFCPRRKTARTRFLKHIVKKYIFDAWNPLCSQRLTHFVHVCACLCVTTHARVKCVVSYYCVHYGKLHAAFPRQSHSPWFCCLRSATASHCLVKTWKTLFFSLHSVSFRLRPFITQPSSVTA